MDTGAHVGPGAGPILIEDGQGQKLLCKAIAELDENYAQKKGSADVVKKFERPYAALYAGYAPYITWVSDGSKRRFEPNGLHAGTIYCGTIPESDDESSTLAKSGILHEFIHACHYFFNSSDYHSRLAIDTTCTGMHSLEERLTVMGTSSTATDHLSFVRALTVDDKIYPASVHVSSTSVQGQQDAFQVSHGIPMSEFCQNYYLQLNNLPAITKYIDGIEGELAHLMYGARTKTDYLVTQEDFAKLQAEEDGKGDVTPRYTGAYVMCDCGVPHYTPIRASVAHTTTQLRELSRTMSEGLTSSTHSILPSLAARLSRRTTISPMLHSDDGATPTGSQQHPKSPDGSGKKPS